MLTRRLFCTRSTVRLCTVLTILLKAILFSQVITRRLFCTRSKLEEAKTAAAAAVLGQPLGSSGGSPEKCSGGGGVRQVRSAPVLGGSASPSKWDVLRGLSSRDTRPIRGSRPGSPNSVSRPRSPADRWVSGMMSFR